MLFLFFACTKPEDTAPDKVVGPELSHTPPTTALDGQPLTLDVTATDADGVSEVTLFYRREGLRSYDDLALTNAEGELWTIELPGELVQSPGLEYYFRAVDGGAIGADAYLPSKYNSAPFSVDVGVTGLSFPFIEDFESGDVEDEGWANASQGFVGYGWAATSTSANGGTWSAFHSRGISDIDPLDDWLISPPLDLSQVPAAQVVWYETGGNVGEANHALYVSIGSRDPEDGDYVAVTEALPAPEDDIWARSAIYDLTSFCGAPTAYVAWRAQGENADDWYIDDVRVEAPTADLSGALTLSPDPIRAGESGTLTWTVQNATAVDATGVSVSVVFPEGGASVTASTVDIGTVEGMGSAPADFGLTVDAATLNNSRIPVQVTMTSDADTLVVDTELLIGLASTATVGWYASDAGTIELIVGVGDPDAPTWSSTVYSGSVAAGTQTFSLDVTDQLAYLPPAPGPNRWFLSVDSNNNGAVTEFSVAYDGATTSATVLPEVLADEAIVTWLPEPPDLAVDSVGSTPSTLAPGDAGTMSMWVRNNGADTSGPVIATLSTADADLVITDAGPYPVTTDVLAGGGSTYVSSAFAYTVADTHVDSSELDATLTLTDGVDTWTEAVQLSVPWPVFLVTSTEIDDSGGDGVLGVDETSELDLKITNVGGLSTDGALYGTLRASTTGSAVLSTDGEEHRIGSISSGSTESEGGWVLDVAGGADGDVIEVVLDLYDDSRTYTSTFTITLGEPPWISMSALDDDRGDALDGESDLLRGFYRVYNDQLQLRVEYAEDVDPGGLFFEFWGLSAGGTYDYYNAVFQSNTSYMRGYDSSFGFESMPDPSFSVVDARTIQLNMELAELGLVYDGLSLGFGSGWCGAPEYYCDHMANDWGYPYDALYTSYWYDLSW